MARTVRTRLRALSPSGHHDEESAAEASAMRAATPDDKGWSVRNRLILLVLVPLTVVVASVGLVAQDRRSESQAAADVEAQVDGLRSLVSLQTAIYGERASVELEFRSASFGVPASLGGSLLGVQEAAATFDSTDAALRSAGGGPDGVSDTLTLAREASAAADLEAIAIYERLDDALVGEILASVDSMQRTGLATADAELAAVLEQLEASVTVFSAATNQTTRLASAWFGEAEEYEEAVAELRLATAAFELSIVDIDTARVPADIRPTVLAMDDPLSTAVDEALVGNLSAEGGVALELLSPAIAVFGSSFTRNGALAALVDHAADEVQRTAARIDASAAQSYRMALVIGVVAVLGSLLLSWRLAISIATPMLGVAQRTRDLRGGVIDTTPLPLTGPRELRDVAAALNDVSANLDSLENKLQALARADLSDPVLGEDLPGRLGETLSESVDTLSASIADRADLQLRLAHQANHDSLTGLANRSAALARLAAALDRAEDRTVGLLFVDLDDFKRANDLFGHRTGDLVLVEVARRLVASCRPGDLVARLGGDEFLVVIDADPPLDAVQALAQRIVHEMRRPLEEPSAGGLVVAASAGVALAKGGSIDALEFLAQADAALYRAKISDSRLAVFDQDLAADVFQRASIEQQMRESLQRGDFEVHYQPVLSSASLEVEQVEALIRWRRPDPIGPDVFIPVAETSDLVIDLDRFVLERATGEVASLIEQGIAPGLSVAVNVSGRHLLHADFVDHVAQALAASGLDARALIIEVTETALVADLDRAGLHLSALRDLGVRVSVDDFGTGFTSISQLRRLPIDELKIDRSLVSQLPGDQALVRVVRDLAVHFGMTTVAEGVETQDQADVLRDVGCSQLQGWLYARAMAPDDLRTWLGATSCVAADDSP